MIEVFRLIRGPRSTRFVSPREEVTIYLSDNYIRNLEGGGCALSAIESLERFLRKMAGSTFCRMSSLPQKISLGEPSFSVNNSSTARYRASR